MVTRCDRDEVAHDAVRRRLPVVVASPARDISVASQRDRVKGTRGYRDEVSLDAVGRCLSVVVGAPTRDTSVASKRQGMSIARSNRSQRRR